MMNKNLSLRERADKFSFTKSMGYSLANACNIMCGFLVTYVTFFATNSLFLSAAAVGMAMAVSKIFDGVTDLIAGVLLDKSNTKWGKARPFLLFGIAEWISLVFIFCVPNGSDTMKLIWIFVTYTINISGFQTLYGICLTPLLRKTIVNENQRLKTLSLSTVLTMVVAMAIGIILPIIVSRGGTSQTTWIIMACCFAAVGCLISVIAFLWCKEYTDDELLELGIILEKKEESKKVSFKGMGKAVISNRFYLAYLGIYGIMALYNAISSVAGTYYYSVNVGNLELMSIVTIIGFALFPFLAVYPKLIEKFGVCKFFLLACALTILGTLIRMFSATNVIGICVGSFIAGFSAAVGYVFPIILISCMDYGQMKTGEETEGLYSAVQGFLYKIAAALGSAFLGVCLSIGKYDGSLAQQPQSAYTAINFVFNIFPVIAFALMMLLIFFADSSKEVEKIKAERNMED